MENPAETIQTKIKENGDRLSQLNERVRTLQEQGRRIQGQIVQAVDEAKIVQGAIRALQDLMAETEKTEKPEDKTDEGESEGEKPADS